VALDWSGKELRHVPRIDSESPLHLNLSGNKLRDVNMPPTVITLSLAGNRLQTLDLEALARQCPRLRELNVDRNRITVIQPGPLRSLRKLSLAGNRVNDMEITGAL